MLDYTEIPPAHWQEALVQTRENGSDTIRTRVLWGAHEQVKGVRDFSKSSRLRLERFLGLAHSQGLSVELELGFPPAKDAFPAWTKSLENSATVPALFWENGHEGFCQTTTPSLFDPEVIGGFEGFVEDVMALCQLYQQPEGPVSKVWIDLGVFRADAQALEHSGFAEVMKGRYPDVAALNTVYQTSFRTFESLSVKSSYRVLMDRRAWVASHDFQWCRQSMLNQIVARLVKKFPMLIPRATGYRAAGNSPWEILVDSTFLETEGERCFPCLPGGILSALAVQSFRLAEYLAAHARTESVPLHFSSAFLADEVSQGLVAVICGKYLSRRTMQELEKFVAKGGKLFFPFGAPLYDENLSSWKHNVDKARFVTKSVTYDETAWQEIRESCRRLIAGASA